MNSKSFDEKRIGDPEYFAVNTLDPHSDHSYYASEAEMQTGCMKFRQSLNGNWYFHYAKNLAETLVDFEKIQFNVKNWPTISVPAHIQMEGYDIPHYTNTTYPWDGHEAIHPGEIPKGFNPTASYVKYFTASKEWEKTYISFQGVESAFAVWLNGNFVGYSNDVFTPAEFDLTVFLQKGENKLALQVYKFTSGSWIGDQDFWRFSGIFRDVYLYTVPKTHVRDVFIQSDLLNQYTEAKIKVKLRLEGTLPVLLQGKLMNRKGDLIAECSTKATDGKAELCFQIKDAQLWSAERPYLYQLQLSLIKEDHSTIECVEQKVGLREFVIKNGVMCLNGKRIVFNGVNRHEFSCKTGRVVTCEEMLQDVKIMKQNNINAVRTSHYPNSTYFYKLCDEYGLYMIDETNLETHGTWLKLGQDLVDANTIPKDRKEWLSVILHRAASMLERDKNHPSILIWSCGNEAYGGKDIFAMSEYFRKTDPSRLVHYEGVFHDRSYNETSDMESQMYPEVKAIQSFLSVHRDKPFICCEYTHAMGNSIGGMHKYTNLTKTEPLYQGGFVWDFLDQGILAQDRYGKDFIAFGGDFGDRPSDYNFSGNGLLYADRTLTAKMQEVKFNYQLFDLLPSRNTIKFVNNSLFTNMDEYDLWIVLCRNGETMKQYKTVIELHPGQNIEMPLEFAAPTAAGEYVVQASLHLRHSTLWADSGYEVAFGQYIYENKTKNQAKQAELQLQIADCDTNIGVRGIGFSAMFSRAYGTLVSYKVRDRELIQRLPKLNFWRAPVDNDYGNHTMQRCAQWKIASLYALMKNVEVIKRGNSVSVIYTYDLGTTPEAECKISYTIAGDGKLKVAMDYDGKPELSDLPDFGMLFTTSADFKTIRYYGLGPDENYCDRSQGARLGVFETTVLENVSPYMNPQETGNRTGVRWFEVLDEKGRGLRIEGNKIDVSALPYTPHELENAYHQFELPPVHHTVLKISQGVSGVGGDDSWGAPVLPEYLIPNHRLHLEFSLQGI